MQKGVTKQGLRPQTRIAVAGLTLFLVASSRATVYSYNDWTSTLVGEDYQFTGVNPAGTITATSSATAFVPVSGTFGLPEELESNTVLSTGLRALGSTGVGQSINFSFSEGYDWSSAGRLVFGNIRNFYAYSLSAWDTSGAEIDVNQWQMVNEWQSDAPGSFGYFSTSPTVRTPQGNSTLFHVFDPIAGAANGQGGMMRFDGLQNVGQIRLTLISSTLAPNSMPTDFMIFSVGAVRPVPEPGVFLPLTVAAFGCLSRRRR